LKIKLFFDVVNETRGILLQEGGLPSLSISESDNLKEKITSLYKEYVSQENLVPITRPFVYQYEGEICICYRVLLTIFPEWLRSGKVHNITEILKRGPSDEIVNVIQAFR
jgi:hypothetical protein